MNRDQLHDALSHISDEHIAEAAAPKKRRYAPWITAIAACLVLAIGLGILLPRLPGNDPDISTENPTSTQPSTPPNIYTSEHCTVTPLAAAKYPAIEVFPLDQSDYSAWTTAYKSWRQSRQAVHNAPKGYADNLTGFWKKSTQTFLSSSNGDNVLYSPISLYMALSILAEATNGETRQEILTVLNADSIDTLSQQAQNVFQNQYENDGVHTSILANSLWLDGHALFHQQAVDSIAEHFYASVYRGALESPEMNIALKNWLHEQTGGLLEESINDLEPMNIETALVIASTINYRCKWQNTFSADQNTQSTFHGTKGDHTATFMNRTLLNGEYYWGEGYSATYLSLDDGSRMWLILPNEDTSAEAVLQSGKALDMIFGEDSTIEPGYLQIHLSVPKFDATADLNLMSGLEQLGIRKAMSYEQADFSTLCDNPDGHVWLGRAQQGIRVAIDEDGLTGAAYTILVAPNDGAPLMEEIEFVLDRPFLFVVESSDGLPLFTGIVNNP